MKRILVLYYSQTGQLRKIIDSIVQPLNDSGFQLEYQEIKPNPPFPFPWTSDTFFDIFPETVLQENWNIQPLDIDQNKEYDFIILGYQTWFLSPSLPVSSFLNSQQGKSLLKNQKVITILGVRNMWVMGQEKLKRLLFQAGATLVGNIVLQDKHPNLTSVKTIMKWMFTGDQGPYENLPKAGVSETDIIEAKSFGTIISRNANKGSFSRLQPELLSAGAVSIYFHLLRTEIVGSKMFSIWAKFVRKKGKHGDLSRLKRVRLFKTYLMVLIFVVSPVTALLFKLIRKIFRRPTDKVLDYYCGVRLKQ